MWFADYFCKTTEEQWYTFEIFIVNVKVRDDIVIERLFQPRRLANKKTTKNVFKPPDWYFVSFVFHSSLTGLLFTVDSLWGPVILLGHEKMRCGILVKLKKAVYVRKDFPTTILATSAKTFIVDKNTPLKMWPCWSIAPKMFWGLVWVVMGDSEVLFCLKFVCYKSYCSNISCACTTLRLGTELFTHILRCVVGFSVPLLTGRSDTSWFSQEVNINFV